LSLRIIRKVRSLYWDRALRNRAVVALTYDCNIRFESPTNNVSTRLTYVNGYKDKAVFEWMHRLLRPGMNVLDVGANVGTYALYMAKRVGPSGRVLAIEPSSTNLLYLRRNVGLNGFAQILVEGVAAGPEAGTARIQLSQKNLGGNRVALNEEVLSHEESVPMMRLDDLVAKHSLNSVDFIKIDVEGYEHQVLLGLLESLEKFDPILLIEHSVASALKYEVPIEDTASLLQSYGFKAYGLSGRAFQPYDWSRAHGDAFWSRNAL
jgi:FkbM family methyltransferase